MPARMPRPRAVPLARNAGRVEADLTGTMIAGGILVAIGVFFLIREWLPELSFDWFWPSLLIVARDRPARRSRRRSETA